MDQHSNNIYEYGGKMKYTEENLKTLRGWNGQYPIFSQEIKIEEIALFTIPETGLMFEAIRYKNITTGQSSWMSPPQVTTPPQTWKKVRQA